MYILVFSTDVTSMSSAEVSEFRLSNNNIAVTNFDDKSDAPLLNPTPSFEHAFHNFPDVLETISG
jgi:ATP-dependent RNA helicase DDX43